MPVNNGIEYEIVGESPYTFISISSVDSVNNIDLFLSEIYNGNNYIDLIFDFSLEGGFVSSFLSFSERIVETFDVYEVSL